ncbi:MAG: shikimate kinase [Bacteroidota bacterium]
MAVGKTSIGKQLAKTMGLKFVDLDDMIEEKHQQSIPELFENQGEAAFRGIEKSALHQTKFMSNCVIASGGGTPCFYDNMMRMNEWGVTVYLEMDVSSIAYRLFHAKSKRPLVDGKGEDELRRFVKQHLEERLDYYQEAIIHFNALGFNKFKLEELIKLIQMESPHSK